MTRIVYSPVDGPGLRVESKDPFVEICSVWDEMGQQKVGIVHDMAGKAALVENVDGDLVPCFTYAMSDPPWVSGGSAVRA